ncbi:MAG: hypothetical protein J3K34DRAFT_432164 [Monoraphidium minutum]|nr:MAG: hypothetical protein J3K34DRAFT_432164 [Monoraphidium minutum]
MRRPGPPPNPPPVHRRATAAAPWRAHALGLAPSNASKPLEGLRRARLSALGPGRGQACPLPLHRSANRVVPSHPHAPCSPLFPHHPNLRGCHPLAAPLREPPPPVVARVLPPCSAAPPVRAAHSRTRRTPPPGARRRRGRGRRPRTHGRRACCTHLACALPLYATLSVGPNFR